MDAVDRSSAKRHGCLSVTKVNVRESEEHIYSFKHSGDGKYGAVTFGSGALRVLDMGSFGTVQRTRLGFGCDDVPSTAVKWRPGWDGAEPMTYELASVSSNGGLFSWRLDVSDRNGALLDRGWNAMEERNDTSSVDYAPDGAHIATGGADRIIRVYDVNEHRLKCNMSRGQDEFGRSRPAHSNRIFSVRFVSPHTVLSAGWENPVQVWDLRTERAERMLRGPQVRSDGLDVMGGATSSCVLIASQRNTKQLQVFDWVSGRELVAESEKLSQGLGAAHLTQARFSSESMCVWAAAMKPNVVFCIDAITGEVKGSVEGLETMFTVDCSEHVPRQCVVGGVRESLYVIDLVGGTQE